MVPVFFMEKVVGQCVWHCLVVVVSRDSDFKLYDCGFGIWRVSDYRTIYYEYWGIGK